MTRHRFGSWLGVAALALRTLVGPLTPAIAPAEGEAVLGTVCSVDAGRAARLAVETGVPATPVQQHLHSHCAECLGGAMPALLPTGMALPEGATAPSVVAELAGSYAILAFAALLPPPRGPPSITSIPSV